MRLLLLPTGHPLVFHTSGFGPPRSLTRASTCPWVVHTGFASTTVDIFALFRLGFPMAPALKALTEPTTVTRRIIMQKHAVTPYGAPTACKRVVSGSVSSPNRGSSIFRSRYFSLSDVREYLALEDGPLDSVRIPRGRTYSGTPRKIAQISITGTVTLCGTAFLRFFYLTIL